MDWHQVATDKDRERLRTWRNAWLTALGKIRAAGRGADLTGQECCSIPIAR